MKRLFLLLIFFSFNLNAQDYFIVNDGVKTKDYQYNVFTNANIYSSNGMITNGTLIEKDGKIIDIGVNLNLPNNSIVYDLKGQYIYPSFIETHSSFGVKKPQRKSSGRSSQYEPSRNGYYWNDHILSDYNSFIDYNYNQKEAKGYRDIGFGVVNSHRNDGIHRGTSFAIGLIDGQNESYRVLSQKTAEHYSFSRSLTSGQSYPSSTMGAIALIRQLHYDSDWYSQGESISKDLAIEAIIKNKELPKFFDANDKLNVYRAAKLSEEFDLNFNPHSDKQSNPIFSFFKLIYYAFDYILGYITILISLQRQDKFILFDRYFFDFIVDQKRSALRINKSVALLIYKFFIPKPNRVFFIKADAKKAYDRKKELPVKSIEDINNNYDLLSKSLNIFDVIHNDNLDQAYNILRVKFIKSITLKI